MASTPSNPTILHRYGATGPMLRPLLAALVLGAAAAANASEPEQNGVAHLFGTSIGPDGLIAVWAAVFAALYLLFSYERARGPGRSFVARHAVPERKVPSDAAVARRLFVLHGAAAPATAGRPASPALSKRGTGPPKAREKAAPVHTRAAPARGRLGLGATLAGEETFRVAEEAPPDAPAAPASVPLAPPAAAAVVTVPAPAPTAPSPRPSRVERCAVLRAQGEFAEAERLAREGLRVAGDPGLLLVELSRAEFGLGRLNAAIDTARDAYFASPSRESALNLIRLLSETRRFKPDDGPWLRRAVSRHPRHPLLLQAAGVFESMHGNPCDAERWLRAALPLAPDEAARRAIVRELSRVEESKARGV